MDFNAIASLDRMIACVSREVGFRERVYPGLIKRERMTEAEAQREIATMGEVLAFLQAARRTAFTGQP